VYFLEENKAFVDLRSVHIAVNQFYSLVVFRDFVKLDIWIYDLLYIRIEKAAVCLFPTTIYAKVDKKPVVESAPSTDLMYFISF
jgi:hypothetical protein